MVVLGYQNFNELGAFRKFINKPAVRFEIFCQEKFLVRWPGFEPGPAAWQAAVLARLDYHRTARLILSPGGFINLSVEAFILMMWLVYLVGPMKKGQGSPEHLVMIAVVLIVVVVVLNYILPASKGTPITGIAYIDPELSPSKPHQANTTWIVYKYPENCQAKSTCDFYVSVTLHSPQKEGDKYKAVIWITANKDKIREVHVRLCNGKSVTWEYTSGKSIARGTTYLSEEDFPCELYVVAYMR